MFLRVAVIVLSVALSAAPALAQPDDQADDDIGWEYLIDGGAVPFVYGAALAAGWLRFYVEPPDTPQFFSDTEGGERLEGDTVPEALVTAYASGGALLLGLLPADDSRLFHLKGYTEAVLTTLAASELAKATVGRHRPYFVPGDEDVDARRSFFSAHSSVWFASSTYLGLYLNGHVFSRWRDDDDYAFWAFVPAALLIGSSMYVASTRVRDNRHHVSDVVVGAGVGIATSLVFYYWQESRYDSARAGLGSREDSILDHVQLAPWTNELGATLMLSY